jgi:Bifunctional DNA primase/polymerase, N-terminal/Primase C terminal 1 (PriCT-1)
MLRTALTLAKKGQAVFPGRERDKRPATANGVKDATKDAEIIKAWWQQDPEFNIGMATGAVSGIFAIDIDGVDAELEIRRLEVRHGELPSTVEVVTGNGRHLYFKMPDVPVRNSAGKIAPGVDVRGDAGYVLVPPSTHPSGKRYAWSVDSAGVIAEAPDWLLARVTERTGGNRQATPPSEWRALMAEGVPEGRRDCTLARITGYLLRHHIDPVFAASLVQIFNSTRCAPPLPSEDVARIVDSIAGKELRRRQNG